MNPVLAASILALAMAGAADAAPVRISWSTYLRAGPGPGYAAIDELPHGAKVLAESCARAWCPVTVGGLAGFVDRDALNLPRAAPSAAAKDGDCVVAPQAGPRRSEPTRFCAVGPRPRL